MYLDGESKTLSIEDNVSAITHIETLTINYKSMYKISAKLFIKDT